MPRPRAILKRRKAVRNICKITRTMQMIATVRFQRALRRAVATKAYAGKLRQIAHELVEQAEGLEHPLLGNRQAPARRVALVVLTGNRGLAGAYNIGVLRAAGRFIEQREQGDDAIDLYVVGRKGVSYFRFHHRPVVRDYIGLAEEARFEEVRDLADYLIGQFVAGEVDSVHVAYSNFLSASRQVPEVMALLPLAGVREMADHIGQQVAEQEAQARSSGLIDEKRTAPVSSGTRRFPLEISPSPRELLEDLLPQLVSQVLYQCLLDAASSENAARMVAMKNATDNADKMVKDLTRRYNLARQTQITTELSEIIGAAEALR